MDANAHEIIPHIWLGNIKAALDEDFLRQNNITIVFNCTKDLPFNMSSAVLRRYRLPVTDNLEPSEIRNMELWAPETLKMLLQEYHAKNNILVHCAAGMQRSAAVVAMLLMVLKNVHTDEAIAMVQEKRSIAFRMSANFKPAIQGFDAYYFNTIQPYLNGSMATATATATATAYKKNN